MTTIPREKGLSCLIPGNDFKNGAGDHYCVEMQNGLPYLAWGIICPTNTGMRNSPPELPGFSTEGSWFDRGHMMALSLGGSDVQENLFPQTKFQNEHGNWRRQEEALLELAQEMWLPPQKIRKRYVYFSAKLIYNTGDGDAYHKAVPREIETTYSVVEADFWKADMIDELAPDRFFDRARRHRLNPQPPHVEQFHNDLTVWDVNQVLIEIEAKNSKAALDYNMGKILQEYRDKFGQNIVNSALLGYFGGDKLTPTNTATVTNWGIACGAVSSSPQIHQETIALIPGPPAPTMSLRDLKRKFEENTPEFEENEPDAPAGLNTTYKRQQFISDNKKTGFRRRESIGNTDMVELNKLQKCLEGASHPTRQTRGASRSSSSPIGPGSAPK